MLDVSVEYFNKYGRFIGNVVYQLPGSLVEGVASYLQEYDTTKVCGQKPSYAYVNTGNGSPQIVIF